jgi:hypothetical protein
MCSPSYSRGMTLVTSRAAPDALHSFHRAYAEFLAAPRRCIGMSSPHKYSLRVAVRWIGSTSNSGWRVVASAGNRVIGTADYSSATILLVTLERAIPDFDFSILARRMQESDTPIVFAAEMDLDFQQLRMLGME